MKTQLIATYQHPISILQWMGERRKDLETTAKVKKPLPIVVMPPRRKSKKKGTVFQVQAVNKQILKQRTIREINQREKLDDEKVRKKQSTKRLVKFNVEPMRSYKNTRKQTESSMDSLPDSPLPMKKHRSEPHYIGTNKREIKFLDSSPGIKEKSSNSGTIEK